MAQCPNCQTKVLTPTKTWQLGPRKGRAAVTIEAYACPSCGTKFRLVRPRKS